MDASAAAPPAPVPAPPLVRACATCEFWSPQVGLTKGICRVAATGGDSMELLSNDVNAMLLTAPSFSCSEWQAD